MATIHRQSETGATGEGPDTEHSFHWICLLSVCEEDSLRT